MRRKVLAVADVEIQQVQVIDKDGRNRSIVLWRCGSDMMFSETMDGLFDTNRRYRCPKWLTEQLEELETSKRFHADGSPYTGETSEAREDEAGPATSKTVLDGFEEDLHGIRQA
jgi:hypothetical protein